MKEIEEVYEFHIGDNDEAAGIRIDKFLSDACELSRSRIQGLIEEGLITVNHKIIKSNYKISIGDDILLKVPVAQEIEIVPENIPLDIVYEDDDVIVVNKPKGMVVHPAAGHYSGTLVNALMYHCKDNLSGINGKLRPGIVHRIDMDTTGLIVACKNDKAHESLSRQLKEHSITRFYHAICYNAFKENEGTVNAPIARCRTDRKKMAIDRISGREAITHYEVLHNYGKYAYIKCKLETGRTHQIRVHMASIGHPLLGDELYSSARPPFRLQGQCLHAKVLGFVHPTTGKYMEFDSNLPDYFENLIENVLKNG